MSKEAYKWYVYKLIDPRNSQVFYIGKGCGDRAYMHQKQYNKNKSSNCTKNQIISSIVNDGMSYVVEYDSYFKDERAAYNQEAVLIASTKNISNIVKNKFKPIVVSFMETIADCFLGRKTPEENFKALKRFEPLLSAEDHIKLYLNAILMTEKAISNQMLRNRVYG